MATRDEIRERMEAGREQLAERMEAGREQWAERKDELAARFSDVSTSAAAVDALGVSLIGAGVGTIVMSLIRRRRGALTYVIGACFIIAGLGFVGGGAWGRRSAHISEAEENVRNQLASLDPIARAQVLKDMAGEQVAPFVRRGAAQE